MASQNKSLSRFDLAGISSAPRGMPQIEVEFDIDANGIIHVSATDKATGKAQRIEIKAGSGLSDDEVERMVRDAELHAEDDEKFRALVESRNRADALVHQTRASLKEVGDALDSASRSKVEDALKATEEAIDGDDKAAIDDRSNELTQAAQAVMQAAAAKAQQDSGADSGESSGADESVEDVVDAEFEEVKDDEKN